MAYHIGIDLGTTYTTAALYKDNRAEIFSLGQNGAAAIPSLVLAKESGDLLTGDAALRQATNTPERLAREFKRRLGDTTPILLGDTQFAAEELSAELLKSVITEVEKLENGSPERITITHPANWGDFKKSLLTKASKLAEIDSKISLLSEPEAAAISYACNEKMEVGEKIAVYDLGGGTFDASILKRTEKSFKILGKPEGIEQLGGIDFDEAIFNHVLQTISDQVEDLDYEDPDILQGLTRLKLDCIQAKETLSTDTDATIPVLLPDCQTKVRITRREFETLCKPILNATIESLQRAIETAQLKPKDIHKILLVGGSSRIPLVAQMITSEFTRPVALDAHPKHSVALGAAFYAGRAPLLTKSEPKAIPAPPKEKTSSPLKPISVPIVTEVSKEIPKNTKKATKIYIPPAKKINAPPIAAKPEPEPYQEDTHIHAFREEPVNKLGNPVAISAVLFLLLVFGTGFIILKNSISPSNTEEGTNQKSVVESPVTENTQLLDAESLTEEVVSEPLPQSPTSSRNNILPQITTTTHSSSPLPTDIGTDTTVNDDTTTSGTSTTVDDDTTTSGTSTTIDDDTTTTTSKADTTIGVPTLFTIINHPIINADLPLVGNNR